MSELRYIMINRMILQFMLLLSLPSSPPDLVRQPFSQNHEMFAGNDCTTYQDRKMSEQS